MSETLSTLLGSAIGAALRRLLGPEAWRAYVDREIKAAFAEARKVNPDCFVLSVPADLDFPPETVRPEDRTEHLLVFDADAIAAQRQKGKAQPSKPWLDPIVQPEPPPDHPLERVKLAAAHGQKPAADDLMAITENEKQRLRDELELDKLTALRMGLLGDGDDDHDGDAPRRRGGGWVVGGPPVY